LKKQYGVNWAGQAAYNSKFDTNTNRVKDNGASVVRLIDLSKDKAIQSATKEYNDKVAQVK